MSPILRTQLMEANTWYQHAQETHKEEEPPKNGGTDAAHSKQESFDAGSYGFFGGAPSCHAL